MLPLRDIPSPEATADEVKIRVCAFGSKRGETYLRAGKMDAITTLRVPGIEAVAETIHDPVRVLRVGQCVATAIGGMQFSCDGSPAEQATVLRSNAVALGDTSFS